MSSDMEDTKHPPPNRIVDFFAAKTILITGASGFLGKVLIEKLLRSCTSLDKIYVIIREKRGKNAQERLREILNGPLFDRVRNERGASVVEKVDAVSGDISAPDLGLSPENRRKLLEEVEIIYHSAATVKFDGPLRDTILLNVRGTKLMLDLAKECKKLIVFSYISTAYCNEDQAVLTEKFYPAVADPHTLINLCDWLSQDILDNISNQLRGISINNYTFSKALGEALVEGQKDHLPVIIQRPSVVLPVWKEPLPGWTDNLNGPIGLLVGGGKGVLRTMYAREDIFLDAVPVDIIVNGVIMSTYDFCANGTRRIYNLTASDLTEGMEITAKRIVEYGRTIVNERVAFSQVLWCPAKNYLTQSRVSHVIAFFLYQLLPALFLDAILCVMGIKPFLLKVQKRIWNGYQVFEYYANRRWEFQNENLQAVKSLLNSSEREMLKYDAEGMDIFEYLVDCIAGCRRYVLKEPEEDKSAALRRMKMLRYLDFFCKTVFLVGLLYYCYNKLVFAQNVFKV